MIRVDSIDHVVLTVRDLASTCHFYSRVLGMQVSEFEGGRKALVFGHQKLNLHEAGREFEPKAVHPTPGSTDLCFVTRVPIPEVLEHVRTCQAEVVAGPVPQTGAAGPMTSVYVRDPDGNLIEIARYD
jgi:catechol 2,3-dioxygenase-like lactoylglutathione lyase family enzyme